MLKKRVVQHCDESGVVFAQHGYEDIVSVSSDARDRLMLTLEYSNDHPYQFIVTARDRHKILTLLAGRLHLYQTVLRKLEDGSVGPGDREIGNEKASAAARSPPKGDPLTVSSPLASAGGDPTPRTQMDPSDLVRITTSLSAE